MNTQRIEYELDLQRLVNELYAHTGKNSLRDMADECGLSASTLSRMNNGMSPDMATFLQLCAFLDRNPGDFFVRVVWTRKTEDK
jgi:DNA-binding Xre family transcriptional regulator